ncbi:hypothetical protein DL93DRAFT_2079092 [Clavulina sp. PMI_390]|nr:hypothetical protein DL93DRAFT_2079092 [Clavulina sp. PMI_390]
MIVRTMLALPRLSWSMPLRIRPMSTNATPQPASTAQAIDLIRSEPSQYVVAVFLGRRYILSPRDLLTVPRIRDVSVGDILNLNAIQEVGSRQYTLRGDPVLPKDTVRVTAVVVEHTKGALQKIEKFKRRKGYHRSLDHKQTYTKLRIGPIHLGTEPGSPSQ